MTTNKEIYNEFLIIQLNGYVNFVENTYGGIASFLGTLLSITENHIEYFSKTES